MDHRLQAGFNVNVSFISKKPCQRLQTLTVVWEKNSQWMITESTKIKSTDKNIRCTINQLASHRLTKKNDFQQNANTL